MPVFRARNRIEILRDMIARVVARSRLAGLTRNSATYHVLAAAADEDAEEYFQLARLRDLFSIDRATGTDLDERAAEIEPGTVTRISALQGTGLAVFSRPGTTGTISIPTGTGIAARDAAGTVRFRTTAPGSITPGNSDSAPIPIVAVEAGTRGNVGANQIVIIQTRIPGVTSVTNPTAVTNGRDRESDDDFRTRIKAYVRSLPRGTMTSLETAVKGVQLADGRRILFAKGFKDAFVNGKVYLYVDDATGSTDQFDDTYIGTFDVILNPAAGGERRVFTNQRPIRDDGTFVLQVNGVTITRNVDYVLDPTSGQCTFTTTSYPTGLTAGDIVRAHYRFYTGLIQEAQRVINGDASDPLGHPGIKSAGDFVQVLPPQRVPQTLVAGISVVEGFDINVVAANVATAIQQYINGLDIGESVVVSKIIQVAMEVEGVKDFQITSLTGSAPPVNQVILENQVARIAAGDISLV